MAVDEPLGIPRRARAADPGVYRHHTDHTDETALRSNLSSGYDRFVRPSSPSVVTIYYNIRALQDLDITEQEITLTGWMTLWWTDPRLAWDNSSNKIDQMEINWGWRPEFVISNSTMTTYQDVPDGDTITYVPVTDDGYRLCPFQPQTEAVKANFESVPNKKCRDDDILLCSYPKTGTNWLWEMVAMVLNKQGQVMAGNKGPGMVEAMPEAVQEALPSPRIINSHLKFKYLPKGALEKKLKCVLLCRNPKDTVVSFYNHTKGIGMYEYEGKFENYLQMFMRGEVDYGSYPDYLLEWQQAIRDNPDWAVHVMYYEDMKNDCYEEMKKLVEYLAVDVDDSLLREIVASCDMSKIKQNKLETMPPEMMEHFKKVTKGGFTVYRKGVIGDWKNWFTVAQSELFDAWWAEKTANLDLFKFRYT